MAVAYDPAAAIEYVFKHDHWDTPKAIIRAVMQPHARVAVKACHASSKTFTAADIALFSLIEGGDVIVTAPTWVQVEQVLFGQVHAAMRESRIAVTDWSVVNKTEIRLPTGELLMGLSTDVGVRFQGHHARPGSFLLLVADEAPGVRPDIFEAWEGISAGGDVRHLLLGNPVISSGYFFDIFANESPGWCRFTIDAFDTPNLRGLSVDDLLDLDEAGLAVSERPYLVDRAWVAARYHEWGVDHPLWQSRVRGQFPLQADDALLSLAWLDAAAERGAAYAPGLPIQAGIDVAGPGDDETVLCVRQGDAILHLQAWAQADARGPVIAALRPWQSRGLESVNVDSAGLGHYFLLALRDAGLPVAPVNVGEAPTTDKAKATYANLRAQVFWAFREWAEAGMLAGLVDRKALTQLAGIRYAHDVRGRIVIEKKDDARKRGVKSPDRAEAVVLAFWTPPKNGVAAALGRAMRGTATSATSAAADRLAERRAARARRDGSGWR